MPTPVPRADAAGALFVRWGGEIVSLFPWVAGRTLARAELTPVHAAAVGTALAKLHLASDGISDQRPGRYEPAEIDGPPRAHRGAGPPRAGAAPSPCWTPELARLRAERVADIPLGIIHGDLFVDNVLYDDAGTLTALIDFEQASWGRLAYDLAVTTLAFGYGRDDFRPEIVRALVDAYAAARPVTDAERAAFGAELRFVACRFAVTRITDVHLKRDAGAAPGKNYQRYLDRLASVKKHLAAGDGLLRSVTRVRVRFRSGLLADHVDVLAQGVLALFVQVDVADAHVHRRLAVRPHDLAGDRDRRVELGKVQHQVDQRADLLDARGLDADTAQRDVLDAMEQQHLVAGVVDVGVDFEARELARVL